MEQTALRRMSTSEHRRFSEQGSKDGPAEKGPSLHQAQLQVRPRAGLTNEHHRRNRHRAVINALVAPATRRAVPSARPAPATLAELAASFQGARADRMAELLDALIALGQARRLEDGRVAG